MAKAKSIVPGTDGITSRPSGISTLSAFVGGHDVQGTDGVPRTDRPGELLGTVAGEPTDHDKSAREKALAQTDFVTAEVDRNNREVLPLLGGPNADALGWEADKGGVPEFIANARTIKPK